MESEKRKRIFSGIQPSGSITLGNYLGALQNWVNLQEDNDCIYCLVNMHAITVRRTAAELRQQTLEGLSLLLACGVDPQKSIVFIQSHVPQHAELSWVLSCYTMFGELNRMTQFKDKSQKHPDNINAGLFTYPVLMVSDILLYLADLVPVGEDQRQHLELTRDVAQRFNYLYSDTFVVPEAYIPKAGARIMSLQDPTQKMSKSDPNPGGSILMSDPRDVIIKKFKRAVTDSEGSIRFDPENKPGVSNLISIYSAVTGKSFEEIEHEFDGQGYDVLKNAVAETVADKIDPIRLETQKYMNDKSYLESVYTEGAQKAEAIARRTMDKVWRKIGFVKKG